MATSFFDLDFIIEINQQRVNDYNMAKQHKKEIKEASSATTTITTQLPGLRDVEVIVSHPSLIKENSSKITKK